MTAGREVAGEQSFNSVQIFEPKTP